MHRAKERETEMTTPQELRTLAEQIKLKFGDAGRVPVEPDALIALLDQIEQLHKQKADWVETARNLRAERMRWLRM
jgi:hypothetical protein